MGLIVSSEKDMQFLEVQSIAEAEKNIKMLAKMSVLGDDSVKMLCNGVFVWATVVFLGGLASDLLPIDFRLVFFILVTQFIRQYGSDKVDLDERKRQGALEHFDLLAALDDDLMASKSISVWRLIRFFLAILLVLPSRVNRLMAFASTFSAGVRLLGVLLGNFDFGSKITESNNGGPALLLFYSVVVMEGALSFSFLGYVTYKFIPMKILCELYGLEASWGLQVVLAIYYNMRASIRRGTPIENLRIEVLPFALNLFEDRKQSSHFGVLILSSLARGKGDLGCTMRRETLGAIINRPELVERLLAIVSSTEPDMEHFRLAAAQILLELCSVPQYCGIMTANPGFLRSIETLLVDLTFFCPSSSSGKRVKKRHSTLEPMLKQIGSKILYQYRVHLP